MSVESSLSRDSVIWIEGVIRWFLMNWKRSAQDVWSTPATPLPFIIHWSCSWSSSFLLWSDSPISVRWTLCEITWWIHFLFSFFTSVAISRASSIACPLARIWACSYVYVSMFTLHKISLIRRAYFAGSPSVLTKNWIGLFCICVPYISSCVWLLITKIKWDFLSY